MSEPSESSTPITIDERQKTSESYEIEQDDIEYIRDKLNSNKVYIKCSKQSDGRYRFRSLGYIGVTTLPSGRTLRAIPRVAGQNAIFLIRYAKGITGDTERLDTSMTTRKGSNLFEPLASYYADCLEELNRSSNKLDSERVRRRTNHINSRKMAELAAGTLSNPNEAYMNHVDDYNTNLNRLVLGGGFAFLDCVGTSDTASRLNSEISRLQKRITKSPIQSERLLEDLSSQSLSPPYDDLVELSDLVLSGDGSDIHPGSASSHSHFINMANVFEDAVQRAVRKCIPSHYSIAVQASRSDLITGPKNIKLIPDLVIYDDRTGRFREPILIMDTKWSAKLSNDDFYQIATYQAALAATPLLIFPDAGGTIEGNYHLQFGYDIQAIELPVAIDVEDYEEFEQEFESAITSLIPGTN